MIDSDAYLHLENKKLKKTDKIDSYFKKMILIKYKNHSIYHLYNKKSNLIFVSCSIDVNESSMLKNLIIAEVYEVKSSIAESVKFDESSAVKSIKFDESFISESHKTESFIADKLINKSIFEHIISSVRDKYRDEDKMSSSSS